MNTALDHCRGHADVEDIMTHFLGCDAIFLSALCERTNLLDYASKLHARALRFETWSGDRLVGLLAVYHDADAMTTHISNVSVLKEYARQGVAGAMLTPYLAEAAHLGLRMAMLEVAHDNQAAISLYRKLGFFPAPAPEGRILRMQLHFVHP